MIDVAEHTGKAVLMAPFSERWHKVMNGLDSLTDSEKAVGWHFCKEQDSLLGPGMLGFGTCKCALREYWRLAQIKHRNIAKRKGKK